MSSELVNINDQSMTPYQQASVDAWGDSSEEIRPQYIQLKQPKTNLEGFENGTFVYKTIGKSWKTLSIVPLKITLTRRKQTPFKKGEKRKLLCRSNDRVNPVADDQRFRPLAHNCAACPYGDKAWDGYNRETGEGTKPSCDKEVQFLFINEEDGLPYLFTANGINVLPAENMYKAMKAHSIAAQAEDATRRSVPISQGIRPMPFHYRVEVTTERDPSDNYRLKFTKVQQMKPEEYKQFGALFDQFVTRYQDKLNQQADESEIDAELDAAPAQPQQTAAYKPVTYDPPPSRRSASAGPKPSYRAPVHVEVTENDKAEI